MRHIYTSKSRFKIHLGYVFIMAVFLASNISELKAQVRDDYFPAKDSLVFQIKQSIYHKGWIDLNKNGKKDVYENPDVNIDKRIDDLLSRMNVNEKTAQLATLYGYPYVLDDRQPTKAWLDTTWINGLANIDQHLDGRIERSGPPYLWPVSLHAKALNNVQRFFIEQTRLGVPVDFTTEAARGTATYKGTTFPVELARGSTWNPLLENKVGHVAGREARVAGYSNIYGPILGLARDPRWGRVSQSYSEDPYLASKMGVAMVKGIQDEGVASTAKHYAVYSVPKGGRDGGVRTDPHVTPQEVHTLFLRPFEAASKAGIMGMMTSYNDYNGVPITGSHYFLTELNRDTFGFKGYYVTDSGALKQIYSKHHVQPNREGAIKQALEAGTDVRTEFNAPYHFLQPLRKIVREGKLSMQTLDDRVREVLWVKYKLGLFDRPYDVPEDAKGVTRNKEALATSLKAAKQSLILLKNDDQTLPLNKGDINSILVAGANAVDNKNTIGGHGYSTRGVTTPSILSAIKERAGDGVNIQYVKGPEIIDKDFPKSDIVDTPLSDKEKDEISKAVKAAKESDIAIVVIGENIDAVGEGRSRVSLNLPGHQLSMVKAIQETGTPVVAVVISGRPLSINWLDDNVKSILQSFFGGETQGKAIASTLFGDNNPSGKLTVTVPKSVGQIPIDFPYKAKSQGQSKSEPVSARVVGPLYPFGYGLSYTDFEYSDLKITPKEAEADGSPQITVSAKVGNIGDYEGDEIVQLYLNQWPTPVSTPVKVLRGFKRITLKPGEAKTVEFKLTSEELKIYNSLKDKWEVIPGPNRVMVGSSSEDIRLKGKFELE